MRGNNAIPGENYTTNPKPERPGVDEIHDVQRAGNINVATTTVIQLQALTQYGQVCQLLITDGISQAKLASEVVNRFRESYPSG